MEQSAIKAFRDYLRTIEKDLRAGNASERTHYPALKNLLEALRPGLKATVEPRRIDCGAPDFIVTRGNNIPLGYVEAKDAGISLLKAEKTDQLKRYFQSLSNLILTDYTTFRLYREGVFVEEARLASVAPDGKISADSDDIEKTHNLIVAFLESEYPIVGTPRELASGMARLAHLCRDTIEQTFTHEDANDSLHTQLEAFRDNLIPDLKPAVFADMYAQTIAYGLFAARCECDNPKEFSRKGAAYLIPKTNPFLREFFDQVAGPNLDDRIEWVVEDLVELLRRADIAQILRDFGERTRREDPVVHFYETFLQAYDPQIREMRGVYYTPEPAVNYIVRAIDEKLKTEFGRPDGLADPNVYILDPACGTSTFLYATVKHIYAHLQSTGQAGAWDDYVEKHLLTRLFGFELLMAPYAVAHLKLALLLKELGYTFKSNERLNIYLTNTLEEAAKKSEALFARFISNEANNAIKIKKELPIMVVLGNPPYSGHSANRSFKEITFERGAKYERFVKGQWVERIATKKTQLQIPTFIGRLINDYKLVDGEPLGEKNPKWLQDDYVKFIRFAQWRIEQTGHGIIGFITNHSYLDNPTFRGMRQSLMKSFDTIDILDLHGNSKRKETCPDGSKDENVFAIQQGVAIAIYTKLAQGAGKCRVKHGDIWGKQAEKYKTLDALDPKSRHQKKIAPKTPDYYFIPRDISRLKEYESFWKITDIMEVNSVGIVTSRDSLVLGFDKKDLVDKIKRFADQSVKPERIQAEFGIRDSAQWNIAEIRAQLGATNWKKAIIDCLYRPFDTRSLCYEDLVIERSRKKIMRHMMTGKNLSLCVGRAGNVVGGDEWSISFCAKKIVDFNVFYRGGNVLFPLYLYSEEKKSASGGGGNGNYVNMMLFEPGAKYATRRANLNPAFVAEMEAKLKMRFVETGSGRGDLAKTFGPEDVFHYIYAVLHSPAYRSRYAEFLKSDYPRLPLTSKKSLFKKLVALGEELAGLHLMESTKLDKLITAYNINGDNIVEQVRYLDTKKRVYINKTQFFENIAPEVWNFHIGGYQVCEKWLKDRKERKLSFEDIRHYQQIIVAIGETIDLMSAIDKAIPAWPVE